jgi:hypothetical protein
MLKSKIGKINIKSELSQFFEMIFILTKATQEEKDV